MSERVYVIDTSVFIDAARRYYAFDIAPGFWENLVKYAEDGRVVSIDHVHTELRKGEDELRDWADGLFRPWFRKTDNLAVIANYGEIMDWVQQQSRFNDAERAQFADGADGWLIAYAKCEGCALVTQEVKKPASKKVSIPDACEPFGVSCQDTFQMMRELVIRLT